MLSDDEFTGRYGADFRACYDGPSLAEVDTVMTHAPTPEPPEPIDPTDPESVFWQLLMNCITAVGRASCEDVASGALLEDGDYCGDDVMQGLAPQPSLGDHECGDLVPLPDATSGP